MSVVSAKRRPERIALRVDRGCLIPADGLSTQRLRARKYGVGDIVFAEIRKPRHPVFHRLAHQLGTILAENIEAFSSMDAHAVLKRLQWEANIGCEEVGVQVPGVGLALMRFPRSLSFESMEQGEFREVVANMCRHVSTKYWPSMTAEQIEAMADCYVEAA